MKAAVATRAQEGAAEPPACSCALRSSRLGRAAVALFLVVFVTVQLLVPVAALYVRNGSQFAPGSLTAWHGGQIYLAWQMFSTSTTSPLHDVELRDGTTVRVDPVARYGWLVGRAHYTGEAARRLCGELPGAVAVRHVDRVVRCGDG